MPSKENNTEGRTDYFLNNNSDRLKISDLTRTFDVSKLTMV